MAWSSSSVRRQTSRQASANDCSLTGSLSTSTPSKVNTKAGGTRLTLPGGVPDGRFRSDEHYRMSCRRYARRALSRVLRTGTLRFLGVNAPDRGSAGRGQGFLDGPGPLGVLRADRPAQGRLHEPQAPLEADRAGDGHQRRLAALRLELELERHLGLPAGRGEHQPGGPLEDGDLGVDAPESVELP